MNTVTITPATLSSIASLAPFTDSRAIPASIGGIRVVVDPVRITAYATDRYRVIEVSTEHYDSSAGTFEVTLPTKPLIEFSKSSKIKGRELFNSITLSVTDDTVTMSNADNGSSITTALVVGNYPPLTKLFDRPAGDTGMIAIKPSFLADLTKVVDPHGNALKEFWTFEFAGDNGAVLLTPTTALTTGDTVRAMVQPKRVG
jgi:DNA polymerase III sliding clamp (beta) subunit (PCNA family)